MAEKSQDTDFVELRADISSAFQKLLFRLKTAVPIATAVSVALMLGSTSVKILSAEMPRILAAPSAMFLIIVIYIGCYKAVLVLLGFLEILLLEGSKEEFESQSDALRRETSIMNPFSSSKISSISEGSIIDYIGLLTILLPIVIIFVTGIWVESDFHKDSIIAFETNERLKDAIPASRQEVEKYDEDTRKRKAAILLKAMDESEKAGDKMLNTLIIRSVSKLLQLIFGLLYGYFIYRIWKIIMIVNTDCFKRTVILVVSLIVLFVPIVIIQIIWSIKEVSLYIKLLS